MNRGKLKKFFPGGNTSQGFYSYYDYLIEPDATKIFVLKGGPGVGKSSFMRFIGETMLAKGYDVEFHCCSSDNDSLDGVCIPQLGIALLDGTAPHIVDPKNPGAVDEIVHLGDFWNEDLLRKNKTAIISTTQRVGQFFKMAYFALKEAKIIQEEWESYITEATDFGAVNKVLNMIADELFTGGTPVLNTQPKARRLFATAISPKGCVNHLDTILQDVKTLYVIKGEPGCGKSTLIGKIADRAQTIGLKTEIYHCAFVPQKIDTVVIPDLSAAVANLSPPVSFDPACLNNLTSFKEINLSDFLNQKITNYYSDEISDCKERFETALNRGIKFINRAKAEHDILESYYVPAMDFKKINDKKNEILDRILKFTAGC